MSEKRRLSLVVDAEMFAAVEVARRTPDGDVPREMWLRRAVERAVATGEANGPRCPACGRPGWNVKPMNEVARRALLEDAAVERALGSREDERVASGQGPDSVSGPPAPVERLGRRPVSREHHPSCTCAMCHLERKR